ncbi:nicotinate-nucleotide--dimethylbenzimidazole phosphoribosyltransferase [Chitinilyticum piscinae]|uniref:Nicotinate-nucleotide--dimethylbenzimidazole phosphoribosyltransferase n=1 Tax=Chitinilyticum piscinae TaxID=2866724 RepID=A0A8J7G0P1_9NEIS|nr:nicotinate-nucleotide--dimethylbenzimidazole phosphoribosyltransferase [Chitinilyticum piscinae]MBE9609203.1 nicotinate-nucleotide--dimethylbenzimidazole phosphoribosyltransferase [Chitinilyticum piscinae]
MHFLDLASADAARARQQQLTKPPGSLGKLEDLAIWFAARLGSGTPGRLKPAIVIFAADHGVASEGVSAYPAEVTSQMVLNFLAGGAAINVLAREGQATLAVVDVGVATDYLQPVIDPGATTRFFRMPVRAGTGNLRREAAMSRDECRKAWHIGAAAARQGQERGKNLLIGGEMGIANTTAAAALICALTGADPAEIVGLGTGIDAVAREHKVSVVRDALARAREAGAQNPMDWLAEVGGLEIAALAGFYSEAAALGVPVLLDGFISTAAALVAVRHDSSVGDWLLASHASQELGHRHCLSELGLSPLLDFNLRLGEASGAALVLPLLQTALALHRDMATFAEAGVAGPAA